MCIPRKYKWQVRYFIIYHERALHDYFINIPCHRNTVDSTIKATCARRMMGRVNVIQRLYCNLIGCIFYGMAYKRKQISVNTRAVIRQFSRPHSTVEPGKIENCFCGKKKNFCHLSPSAPNFNNDFILSRFAFDVSQKFQAVPREQKSFPNPSDIL